MDHYNLSLVSDSSLEAVVSLFKTRAFQCWIYIFLMYWNYVKYVGGLCGQFLVALWPVCFHDDSRSFRFCSLSAGCRLLKCISTQSHIRDVCSYKLIMTTSVLINIRKLAHFSFVYNGLPWLCHIYLDETLRKGEVRPRTPGVFDPDRNQCGVVWFTSNSVVCWYYF